MKALLIELVVVVLLAIGMHYAAVRAGKNGYVYAAIGVGTYVGAYLVVHFGLADLKTRYHWRLSPDMERLISACGVIFRVFMTAMVYVLVSKNWRQSSAPPPTELTDDRDLLDQ